MLLVLVLIIIAIVAAVAGVKNHKRYREKLQIEDFMRCHFFYLSSLICMVGAMILSVLLGKGA